MYGPGANRLQLRWSQWVERKKKTRQGASTRMVPQDGLFGKKLLMATLQGEILRVESLKSGGGGGGGQSHRGDKLCSIHKSGIQTG